MTTEARCVLCGAVAGAGASQATMTPEARETFIRSTGADPDSALARNVVCAKCSALPDGERRKLAAQALQRELGHTIDLKR